MKRYSSWQIAGYSGVVMILLPIVGRYVGVGVNITHSAPYGIYFYYPVYGPLKQNDLVDFSLTAHQATLANHCIAPNEYGLKRIGGEAGMFLITKKKRIYACRWRFSSMKAIVKHCRFLGICLRYDHQHHLLQCQHWVWKKITRPFVYVQSVLSDEHQHTQGCDSRYFGLIQRRQIHHRLVYIPWQHFCLIFLLLGFPPFVFSTSNGASSPRPILAPYFLQLRMAERGYWFYKNSPRAEANKLIPDLLCRDSKRWQVGCGFIDPHDLHLTGNNAYRFEQKQYHALLNDYALRPNNLEVALRWQRFNQWVIHQSVTAAYAMQFTLSAHPELNGGIYNPFSNFGRLVLRHIETKNRQHLLEWLSKSSLFIFFSRSDCPYCQAQSSVIAMLSRDTGIPVWNASLDKRAMPVFQHSMTAPDTIEPARLLKVTVVPTLFLYLPRKQLQAMAYNADRHRLRVNVKNVLHQHNDTGVWLRLATGVTSEKTIEDRLVNFVLAYRQAMVEGLHTDTNRKMPLTPDFSYLFNEEVRKNGLQ